MNRFVVPAINNVFKGKRNAAFVAVVIFLCTTHLSAFGGCRDELSEVLTYGKAQEEFSSFVETLAERVERGTLSRKQFNEKVLEAAETHLTHAGIRFKRIEVEGFRAIQVAGKKNGHPLEKLTYNLQKKFNRLEVFYAPGFLNREGVGGLYDAWGNRLFLSHDTIMYLKPDGLTLHEILHAVFERTRRTSSGTIFDVHLGRADDLVFSDMKYYAEGFYAEELVTYAYEVRLAIGNLKSVGLSGGVYIPDLVWDLLRYADIGVTLSKKIDEASASLLNAINKSRASETFMPGNFPTQTDVEYIVGKTRIRVSLSHPNRKNRVGSDGVLVISDEEMDKLGALAQEKLQSLHEANKKVLAAFKKLHAMLKSKQNAMSEEDLQSILRSCEEFWKTMSQFMPHRI